MKARINEIEIEDKEPFKNDLLDRKQYAEILTSVISHYSGGAVIALNGEWGTGKTTFVKMWKQHLSNKGFPTIYFDAWKSDLVDDPLLPLIGNLKQAKNISTERDDKLKKVITNGAKILAATAKGAATQLAKKTIGKTATEAIEGGLNELENIFFQQIDEFALGNQQFDDFKKDLAEYVRSLDEEKPLVYFVDELDRCNPTYAVKVLERIKHLFDIPQIIFVLSVDKLQFEASIKGYFGSDQINAEEYLRRFIDISYNLPKPEIEKFCNSLYSYYGFEHFFNNIERSKESVFSNESYTFLNTAHYLTRFKSITLRQLDRIFSLSSLALHEFEIKNYIFPGMYFFLVYLKICHQNLFDKIVEKSLSIDELVKEIENLITEKMLIPYIDHKGKRYEDNNSFYYSVAQLLVTYLNNEYRTKTELVTVTNENNNQIIKLNFKTSKLNDTQLANCIQHFNHHYLGGDCPIDHITEKINLLNAFRR